MEKEQNKNIEENINVDKDNEEVSNNNGLKDNEVPKDNEKNSEEKTSEDKVLELEDKLTRTFAEMENQRRRFEKEKQDAFEYGGFNFAKEALNLIDNLERSKHILENDKALQNSEVLKKALEHLEIIKKDIISVFLKNNIKPIDCLNKKLDPNYHQAMIEIEDDEKEPGTIVQEIQKGFTIKERLLRPSLVGVSKKIESKDKKNEENKQNSGDK